MASRPLLQRLAQGQSQTAGRQGRAPGQPSSLTAAAAGRSHDRGPASAGVRAVWFSRRVAALLRKAMALKRRPEALSPHRYAVARGRLHAELDRLLAGNLTDPDDGRLALWLRKQRAHLSNFLDYEGLDATNNLAEREIRPAVIAPKLSAGNRTEAGAETHAVVASFPRTCRRHRRDNLQVLGELIRRGPEHVINLKSLPTAMAAPSPSHG